MRVEPYNFFFHPLHEDHSSPVKALGVITNLALAILSSGLYLLVFALVRCSEEPANKGFVGIAELKRLQKAQLDELIRLSNNGEWIHLQTHTAHEWSGFDWWMFPTDRLSSYGDRYQVNKTDIETLKKDPEFMANYRAGVILVAKSWGFPLTPQTDVTDPQLQWSKYNVRLGKMLHSLRLFGQDDLRQALIHCIDTKGIRPTLDDWIQKEAS